LQPKEHSFNPEKYILSIDKFCRKVKSSARVFDMGQTQTTEMSNTNSIRNFIEQEHQSNQVVVWSKSYCPYCHQTKNLFRSSLPSSTNIIVHELDQRPDGNAIQQELVNMTGQPTVPSVWVGGQFIGGNDATQRAHRNGELEKLIRLK
jgi:glutaredoxin